MRGFVNFGVLYKPIDFSVWTSKKAVKGDLPDDLLST